VSVWRRRDLTRARDAAERRGSEAALDLAIRLALSGDREGALASLDRAHAGHASFFALIRAFPELAMLRGDERFERLAAAVAAGS
jgi:hypothetical protein